MIANYAQDTAHSAYSSNSRRRSVPRRSPSTREFARKSRSSRRSAIARELKDRDWRAFHDLAKAAVDEPSAGIVVYDPSARPMLSTFVAYGTDLPKSGNPEAIHGLWRPGSPMSPICSSAQESTKSIVAAYLPVIENDAVVIVVGFSLPPHDLLANTANTDAVSRRARSGVRSHGRLIARTRNEREFVGHLAMPELRGSDW